MTIRSDVEHFSCARIGYSWVAAAHARDKSTHKFLITNLKVGSLGRLERRAVDRPPPHRGDHEDFNGNICGW